MHYDIFNEELANLRIAESGAVGCLKGTVAGLLLRLEVGFDLQPGDAPRLRVALDNAEAAHKAVVDHLCQTVELV